MTTKITPLPVVLTKIKNIKLIIVKNMDAPGRVIFKLRIIMFVVKSKLSKRVRGVTLVKAFRNR